MELENVKAIIEELITWEDQLFDILVMADREMEKSYAFDAVEAMNILRKFAQS